MKKLVALLTVGIFLVIGVVGIVSAEDTQSFTVSAYVPFASGITFTVTEILANGTWTTNHPENLNFGTLSYDSTNQIFRPTKYFAIDLGVVSGGAGQPDNIHFSYNDSVGHPNELAGNGRGGLGMKATAQVVKATEENVDTDVADLVLLSQVASLGTLSKSTFTEGWPRIYVGIYDGSDEALNTAGWEVFTAADAPGDYIGTLQVSATVN